MSAETERDRARRRANALDEEFLGAMAHLFLAAPAEVDAAGKVTRAGRAKLMRAVRRWDRNGDGVLDLESEKRAVVAAFRRGEFEAARGSRSERGAEPSSPPVGAGATLCPFCGISILRPGYCSDCGANW